MRGVFLDLSTMSPTDLDLSLLESTLPHWQMYDQTPIELTAERIQNAEIVVVQKAVLSKDVMMNAKSLRLICVASTGYNNVDVEAAKALNIKVTNVREYATGAVPQHVFSLILALTTRLIDYHHAVQKGRWPKSQNFCFLDYPIRELSNMTLGIIGFGSLGKAVAKIAKGFDMDVIIAQSTSSEIPNRVSIETLLEQSDVISLHCPLTEHTRHLIGLPELKKMKNNALLINTARGGLVDEEALAYALRHQLIGGAGFDVLSVEPPPPNHPLLATDLPNFILTPHVAWGSQEARQCIIDEVAANILAFIAQAPRNLL